jgi:uncharacterized MnhB-related membrane protein
MAELIDVLLFAFLLATAFYVLLSRDLLAVVMVAGIYSLLSAGMFLVMDAADVAFTEAAVGAGVSTLFLLIALTATGRWEKPTRHRVVPLLVVLATGATLVYGTLDLPPIGARTTRPRFTWRRITWRLGRGDRHPERRHQRARELPRLRHPRRGGRGVHRGTRVSGC